MTEQLTFDAVDDGTGATLDLIDGDDLHREDRDRIDAAVRQAARDNGGEVSSNAVRKLLRNEHGMTVVPQCIGPRLRALTAMGVLAIVGWETCDDTVSGNSGRPQRLRRWVA